MSPRLTDEQRIAWLRLIRSENIGPRTFQALVNRYGGAAGALEALPGIARRTGRSGLKVATRDEAEREIEATAHLGGRFIATGEPDYPKTLRAIDSAPPLIAIRGEAKALARPMVAIVGSRNASAAGLTFTERLSRAVGEAGYTVGPELRRSGENGEFARHLADISADFSWVCSCELARSAADLQVGLLQIRSGLSRRRVGRNFLRHGRRLVGEADA